MSDHEVVRAAVAGAPAIASGAEVARRTALSLPPFSALAIIDGDGAERFTDDLRLRSDITVVAHRDRWLVRAPDATSLANAIADTERPANAKLRIEVDPPRL
jgi:hypothetical protein